MNLIFVIPIVASFLITLLLMPFWIRKARQIGLIWEDMNKYSKPKVAGSGGIVVLLGFILGVFVYTAYNVFLVEVASDQLIGIFALTSVVLLVSMLGFIDDLLGWQHGGLSRRSRIVLVGLATVPLIAINAGISSVSLPFVGQINLGIFYPLVIVPIGIIGATTTFNFLAGFNGLEAGQGILILSGTAITLYFTNHFDLMIIALCMTSALIAFLIYNRSPASVFPGDSLTYAVGSLVAILAILGNFEKIALFFFIPVIIEVVLKSRGRLVKQSFGKPKPDGTIEMQYPKIYSLNHAAIFLMNRLKIKATENRVVIFIMAFQLIVIIVGFSIFANGIF